MTARVRAIPEGYHAVTPYLCVQGAASAIEFYKRAFGAREVMRIEAPGGKIGHAEVAIGILPFHTLSHARSGADSMSEMIYSGASLR